MREFESGDWVVNARFDKIYGIEGLKTTDFIALTCFSLNIITRKGKGLGYDIDAVCEMHDGKFVVLKGSLVTTVPRNSSIQKDYGHRRYADLINQKGRLNQDISFDTVSGSSAFFIYGSFNGNVDGKIQKESLSWNIYSDHTQV